jgi:hypothetical protein
MSAEGFARAARIANLAWSLARERAEREPYRRPAPPDDPTMADWRGPYDERYFGELRRRLALRRAA